MYKDDIQDVRLKPTVINVLTVNWTTLCYLGMLFVVGIRAAELDCSTAADCFAPLFREIAKDRQGNMAHDSHKQIYAFHTHHR
ncbi:Hypothetical protein CINCED_3A004672 [Cinara cedri]|uniref:Uncharacterized protein n=1 Tax=Cinara cedri TaxID=506608 RepID=A0A5E4NM80_9HEMI|nr:Hypothetical protein CINCED_3A004672 [Cinara cedri]